MWVTSAPKKSVKGTKCGKTLLSWPQVILGAKIESSTGLGNTTQGVSRAQGCSQEMPCPPCICLRAASHTTVPHVVGASMQHTTPSMNESRKGCKGHTIARPAGFMTYPCWASKSNLNATEDFNSAGGGFGKSTYLWHLYQAEFVYAHLAAIAAAVHWQETAAAAAADDAAVAAAVAAAARMVTAQRPWLQLKVPQSVHCRSQIQMNTLSRRKTSAQKTKQLLMLSLRRALTVVHIHTSLLVGY